MSLLHIVAQCWRSMLRDVTAGVTTLGVLALPAIIGAAGLTVDVSRAYQQKVSNQRAADLAALGAATAYKANQSTSVLQPTAADIVLVNGIGGATTSAQLVSNYPSAGKSSVKVTVRRDVPFYLASVIGLSGSFNVNATAYAQIGSSVGASSPCFLALSSSSSAISVSGGGTISASTCSVAAVGGISQGGTGLTAKDVISGSGSVAVDWGTLSVTDNLYYSNTFTYPNWNTAIPETSKRKHQSLSLSDPWAGSTDRTSAVALLGTYTAVPSLGNPATSGGSAWTMSSSPSTAAAGFRLGSSSQYRVPAGNYTISTLTVAGGYSLEFQDGSNIYINGGVNIGGGSTVRFGNSNVYINGNFVSGSNGVTFGDGVLWMGNGTVTFSGANTKGSGDVTINSTVSLTGGSTLTMGAGTHNFGRVAIGGGSKMKLGAGNFQASHGIAIDGDSELALGAGNVLLGKHSDNNSIYLSGSARFFMGDGTFSASGHVDTSGGSRLVFGATTNHYINGNMNIRGSVLFGAGRYTVNGNFINGTGGTTWPYTSSWTSTTYGSAAGLSGYDMAGVDVTFVLSGSLNLAGGALTHLEAPLATTTGGAIAQLLVTSQTSAATTWGAGSNNKFGGAVHIPNSALTMSGGNGTVGGTSCFSLIASTITVSGGAQTGSACTMMSNSISGAGSGSVRLVN